MSKGTPAGRPKGIHTKKRPIEETIEILILQYLAKHNPNDYTFQDYAKNKTDILGSQSKKASNSQQALRLKINQRIFYLKNHKKSLFRLLRKKGLNTFEGRDIPIDDVNTDQEEEDDINSNLSEEDKEDIQPKEIPPRHAVRFGEEDTMSTTDHQDTTDLANAQDIDIDLDYNSMNLVVFPVLIPGVVLPQAVISGKVSTVTKLTFYFDVPDRQDFFDEKISAYIEPNGESIIFNTMVCVPRKFHNHVADFLKEMNPDAQDAEIKAHGYAANKMNENEALQMNKFRLKLPGNMTVNNDYFNEGQYDLRLKINVQLSKSIAEKEFCHKLTGMKKVKQIKQVRASGFFSVAVDDSLQLMHLAKDTRRSQHDEDCDHLFGDDDESEDNSSRHRTAKNPEKKSTRSYPSSSSSGGILSQASSGIELPSHTSTRKSTPSSSDGFLGKAALKLKDFTSSSAQRSTTTAHVSQASSGIELPSHTSTRKSTPSSSDGFLGKAALKLKDFTSPSAQRSTAHASQASSGVELPSHTSTRKSTLSSSNGFLGKATLKLKDFTSPSAQRSTTTHAHAAKKNNTTGSRYKNKNSPDISDYGLTGNACFNDEDVDDWGLYRTLRRTRSTTAGNGCKNRNTSSRDPPASRHDRSSIADEGEDDRTRKARELEEIERQAREEDHTRKAAREEDRTRKDREARELEEIECQAREAREEIKCQDRAEHRRVELQHQLMQRTRRRMQAERQANHISAPPTAVLSAAIASVSTPSAVISSPVPTQQQQQYELLQNSSRKEGKTRGVVPPPIADVDITSDLLATPLGIRTNGLDTSLSTPMRTLSGDYAPGPSEYAGTQQELPPICFFDPATTGSSPGSFSLGFPDLEEQLDDLSIADQQIVQTPATLTTTAIDNFLFPQATEPTENPSETPGTIVDVASADDNLSILVDAVGHADLAETLSSAGPFTVFAPTDAVWTKALSKPVTEHHVDMMKKVLLCHTVAGTYTAADITNGLTLTTMQGVKIEFYIDGDAVMINGYVIMITGTDILASNGVIHTIDGILFHPRRRRVVKGPQQLVSSIFEARKNMESGTAPEFVFGSPQPTLQVCSNRKSDGIVTSTIVSRDGETTGPVTSLHLEEDSDVSDIQVGLDSLSIVADKNHVKDLINNLQAKQKAVDDKKNNHARMLAEKKTLADNLMQELEVKVIGARTRAAKLRIKEKRLALEKAIEDVDSLSAVDDTAARIEDSIVEEKIAGLTNRLEELNKQEEALKKSDDTVLSKEKAESTALLATAPKITSLQQQVRHDNANALQYGKDHANSLQYDMEIKHDFIYKHNDAYLKCKNNRGGDGPVTFFIPMNLALQGAVEFEPKNYIISGHHALKSLFEAKGLVTIGNTTLHFLGDHKNPKVTISGEEELVANIVLTFCSTRDNAVLHLIDRALEQDEPEISDERTLSSIDGTIATGTTFGDHPVLEIIGSPSNLVLLHSSQELPTSSRAAAMSSMSICSNKKDTSNLPTVAAAKTEDNRDNTAAAANTENYCDNMSYGSTKDANNVPVAHTGSITTLEKLQEDMSVLSLHNTMEDSMSVETLREDMSVTSLLDTKEADTSVLCTTLEKLREESMSVTTTMQHENLLHQQPQQQAIVRMPRNEQGEGLPAGFNHQAGESKFSIGYYRTLEWAKKSLNLNPCQFYHIEDMKRAYNQRILETHPDKNMDASEADREKFGEEFRNARAAWNIVKRGNAINKIKRTIITTPRDTTTTPCDTQYANDLKKNLESFKELGSFLKELTRIHGVSYRLAEQRKKFEAHSADQRKNLQAHSADQRKNLQAHLAEVQPDQTTRVAFIMQACFEEKAGVLSLRSEEDQAEMTALIDEAEMPALIDAKSTTTQKHKVDLASAVVELVDGLPLFVAVDPAQREPSTRKKKRQRRDSLEINMNNTGVGNINTRLRSGRRSSPN